MKLSDVMSHSGLSFYAEVAMLIFMATFVAIVIHLFWPSRKDALERQGTLPLADDGAEHANEGARR
jgi:cbb3-type cytochrome oxidase subunit 3